MHSTMGGLRQQDTYLKRWVFSIVRAVTTLVWRSVAYLCSSKEDDTIPAHQPFTPACTTDNCLHLFSRHIWSPLCNMSIWSSAAHEHADMHQSRLMYGWEESTTRWSPVTLSVSAAVPAPQQ